MPPLPVLCVQSAALRNEATQLRSQVELIRAENQRFKLSVETLECKLRAAVDEKMQAEEDSAAIIENLNGTVFMCVGWSVWGVHQHTCVLVCACVRTCMNTML